MAKCSSMTSAASIATPPVPAAAVNNLTGVSSAFAAAINFALKCDEGLNFLECWLHGDFPEIRRDWPDAPETVFIGADPLHPETKIDENTSRCAQDGAALAAIQYALETDEGLIFLDCWNKRNFQAIRREWLDAPKDVFKGVDPLSSGV